MTYQTLRQFLVIVGFTFLLHGHASFAAGPAPFGFGGVQGFEGYVIDNPQDPAAWSDFLHYHSSSGDQFFAVGGSGVTVTANAQGGSTVTFSVWISVPDQYPGVSVGPFSTTVQLTSQGAVSAVSVDYPSETPDLPLPLVSLISAALGVLPAGVYRTVLLKGAGD